MVECKSANYFLIEMRKAQGSIRSEKIVLIGAASSGKTSLQYRFMHNKFSVPSEPTIGAAFVSKTINVNGVDLKLDIWDTGGSEKYKSLAPMYYRDAKAAIIVFDLTSRNSFQEADDWITEFKERGPPTALYFLAANKSDLQSSRQVSPQDIEDFAQSHQVNFYIETSALNGTGVTELFQELGQQLISLPQTTDVVKSKDLKDSKETQDNKSCC